MRGSVSCQAIGRTALVLFPFHDPIPLKRSWCLWEIICTLAVGDSTLDVRMGANEMKVRCCVCYCSLRSAIGNLEYTSTISASIGRTK
jgi:hypothetical protein